MGSHHKASKAKNQHEDSFVSWYNLLLLSANIPVNREWHHHHHLLNRGLHLGNQFPLPGKNFLPHGRHILVHGWSSPPLGMITTTMVQVLLLKRDLTYVCTRSIFLGLDAIVFLQAQNVDW